MPGERLARWVQNFTDSHGPATYAVDDGSLQGTAVDGSTFTATLPFGDRYAGPAAVADFLAELVVPAHWAVLLVRRGGFAVARMEEHAIVASKVGKRHVQGTTKAGGQSQQRFARRRSNQARVAWAAAADHTARVLGQTRPLDIVCGGDNAGLEAVLRDPRLAGLRERGRRLEVADPRRAVLEAAVKDAGSVSIQVVNA